MFMIAIFRVRMARLMSEEFEVACEVRCLPFYSECAVPCLSLYILRPFDSVSGSIFLFILILGPLM